MQIAAGSAVLELGGRVPAPEVAPRIRGRAGLRDAGAADLPETLAPPSEGFPLLARPASGLGEASSKEWARAARAVLDSHLGDAGAVLLRGLPLRSATEFCELIQGLGYEPLEYIGPSSREVVAPNVLTATGANPDRTILLHNEMVAERTIPGHLFLFCAKPPPPGSGGETPIARNADWPEVLEPELLARFESRDLLRQLRLPSRARSRKGSWQERFGCDDPQTVEASRARLGDTVRWERDGTLVLTRRLSPWIEHRGERLWFGGLPNAWPETAIRLLYDDGTPLEEEVLRRARIAQWRIAVAFSWQAGDVLCIDNLGCQHGRLSYARGVDRRIYVSIATPTPGVLRPPAGERP